MKSSKLSLWTFLQGWLAIMLATFLLAGIATTYTNAFTSETVKKWISNIDTHEWLVYFVKSENHHIYNEKASLTVSSLSKLALKLATNIQPEDTRTFLGRELPGFSVFDTNIVVAGTGTNFTNLPIESAPPVEILLQEREIAKEMLKESEGDNTPVVAGKKSVFIYHTHSWESFLPLLKNAKEPEEATSNNESANIIAVGKKLTEELNTNGISVLHDTTSMPNLLKENNLTTDYSYDLSRKLVQEALGGNDAIDYVIDIHRDSLRKEKTTQVINGKSYARLFFVVGKANKNYEQNLKVATELNEMIDEKYPNLSRGVLAKGLTEGNGVYNQDLSTGSILVEFGGVDNDLTELYNTIEAFAEIFSEYYWKAEKVNG
jgi:stage II sporulation protein P